MGKKRTIHFLRMNETAACGTRAGKWGTRDTEEITCNACKKIMAREEFVARAVPAPAQAAPVVDDRDTIAAADWRVHLHAWWLKRHPVKR